MNAYDEFSTFGFHLYPDQRTEWRHWCACDMIWDVVWRHKYFKKRSTLIRYDVVRCDVMHEVSWYIMLCYVLMRYHITSSYITSYDGMDYDSLRHAIISIIFFHSSFHSLSPYSPSLSCSLFSLFLPYLHLFSLYLYFFSSFFFLLFSLFLSFIRL